MQTIRTVPYDVFAVFKKYTYTSRGYTLNYRLYVPKNYDCGERYPLLVFLHGAGERGSDNTAQLNHAVQLMFNDVNSPVYDSIVLVPQCPEGSQWVMTPWAKGCYSTENVPESRELEMVCEVMDELGDTYNVDADRVYVTGLSMGGFGAWDMLMRHGSRFAAGMPICGGGDPDYAKLLKRIPIRTFHGSEDDSVPVTGTRRMYASIKREGGELIDYTEFDGCGHNVWDLVYNDPANLQWLCSQSREERRKAAEKRKKLTKAAGAGGIGAVFAVMGILALNKKMKKKKQKQAKL